MLTPFIMLGYKICLAVHPRRGHGAEFTIISVLAARLARGLRQLHLRPRQLQAAQRRGQCYQR